MQEFLESDFFFFGIEVFIIIFYAWAFNISSESANCPSWLYL